jgi:hypothetical protein
LKVAFSEPDEGDEEEDDASEGIDDVGGDRDSRRAGASEPVVTGEEDRRTEEEVGEMLEEVSRWDQRDDLRQRQGKAGGPRWEWNEPGFSKGKTQERKETEFKTPLCLERVSYRDLCPDIGAR